MEPASLSPSLSPMVDVQLVRLQVFLYMAKQEGIDYVWIDWCCVPQCEDPGAVEVLRSKLYHARARVQIVLPQFKPLPDEMATLLHRTLQAAQQQSKSVHAQNDASTDSSMAIAALSLILARKEVAGHAYFGRAWTLAERLARCGRDEAPYQWMSLDTWLGMVVDAFVTTNKDDRASFKIYFSKLLPRNLRKMLDRAMDKLAPASSQGGGQVPEGLEEELAAVLVGAVEAWRTASMTQVPNNEWLKAYLTKEAGKVYQTYNFRDLVWAVDSYFVVKLRDLKSLGSVKRGLQDLCKVARVDYRKTTIYRLLAQQAKKEKLAKEADAEKLRKEAEHRGAGGRAAVAQQHSPEVVQATVALYQACKSGDEERAVEALESGALVNDTDLDEMGRSPLHTAAFNGFTDIAELLLRYGANLDVTTTTPDCMTPLHLAAMAGHEGVVELLLNVGAQPEGLAQGGRPSPLCLAALWGRTSVADLLLCHGAQVNYGGENGETPLMLASAAGSLDVVRLLLSRGADINAMTKGRPARTALDYALEGSRDHRNTPRHPSIIALLRCKGAKCGPQLP